MLTPVEPRPSNAPPLEAGNTTEFDWSVRMSLDTIRSHTKTDDVPGVTDEQLRLYRAVSIEAAERYTGLLLAGQRTVTEPVEVPWHSRAWKQWAGSVRQHSPFGWAGAGTINDVSMTYPFRLQYPVADGFVYLYGSPHPDDNRAFRVPSGSREIRVPIRTGYFNLSNCCDPCATHHFNAGMMAAYKAGYACVDDVPAGIVLGCLQFVAWVIEHPGDELLAQRNKVEARSVGVDGTNNIAWASGALETWRMYCPEDF